MVATRRETTTRTMEAYDALAGEVRGGYEEHFAKHARTEADYFLRRLKQGDKILDLGCGGGPAARHFVDQGTRPVCGDLSEEMLLACQRRGLGSLVQMDLAELPFAAESFHGVWAHTSLIHIPKGRLLSAIAGIDRVLRPGGRLFIALLEGTEEGYEGVPGRERWFSSFKSGEVERELPSSYRVTRTSRTVYPGRVFLKAHAVKHD